MKGVDEVGVWKCGILGSWNLLLKTSELWQGIRSGWALHGMWCVFAHKQTTGYFLSKLCILFVEAEQNKTRNYRFGASFSQV